MTTTSALGASTTASTSTLVQPKDAVGKKDLNQNDFMTLFITQLQYQDPMKPMDSYEMASQLAQFSSMEATTKMSDNMQKLLDYQTSQNNLQSLSLLGNTVQVSGNNMAVTNGQTSPTEFSLDERPAAVQVIVYDATNKPVWTGKFPPQEANTPYQLAWDGKSASGSTVPDGAYHYQVQALSATGQELTPTYQSTGKVTGVSFASGGTTLTIDNSVQAKVSDVVKVVQ